MVTMRRGYGLVFLYDRVVATIDTFGVVFGVGNVWVHACVKAGQTCTVLCMDGMVSACILKLMCSCVGTCECHYMSA